MISLKAKVFRLALIIVLIVFGAGILSFNLFSPSIDIGEDKKLSEELIEEETKINILLLGIDSAYEGESRADTLVVFSLDLNNNKVGGISIPRDTRVKLPGRESYNKVNAAYTEGGATLTKDTLEDLLDINIDHHLEIDYRGFIDVVDSLGGVEVEIEEDLYYVDKADDLYIDLKAGRQRLDGEDALGYVRYREELFADIGRIERQQNFLEATLDRAIKFRNLLKVPELIGIFNKNIRTDLGLRKIFELGSFIYDFEQEGLEMVTLPGEPKYIRGISYWLPYEEEVELLVTSLIKEKTYFSNKDLNLQIFNGSGRVGAAKRFAAILSEQGYTVEGTFNADRYDYRKSLIFAPQDKEGELEPLINYLGGDLILGDSYSSIKVIIGKEIVNRKLEEGLFS